MPTLTFAPLSIGLARLDEASPVAAKSSPRMVLDPTGAPARRMRPSLRQVAPTVPVRDGAGTERSVEAALLELQDVFFASCADYPSDEQLQQRIGAHCRRMEADLLPDQRRAWRSGRDCLLARLGFRLLD